MSQIAEDDWEVGDFEATIDALKFKVSGTSRVNSVAAQVDEAEWDSITLQPLSESKPPVQAKDKIGIIEKDPSVLILINLTVLSDGKIHNKFDPCSVNDHDAKKELCDMINANYSQYANDSKLIAEGTVRHCSERVWRDALESLRKDHKGQYWFPFFPPKGTS